MGILTNLVFIVVSYCCRYCSKAILEVGVALVKYHSIELTLIILIHLRRIFTSHFPFINNNNTKCFFIVIARD